MTKYFDLPYGEAAIGHINRVISLSIEFSLFEYRIGYVVRRHQCLVNRLNGKAEQLFLLFQAMQIMKLKRRVDALTLPSPPS